MEEIFKLTAKETGQRTLTVNFQDAPEASLEFDVVVKLDKARLRGSLEQERYVLLSALAGQLDIVLRAHYQTEKSDPVTE
ncbi:MAG: hypothetical protein ACKVOO_08200 [Burkholderiaceae bacterium]